MTSIPETRHSLIARLKNMADQAAWEEFVAIYRPVIIRVGIKKGLQPADAEDLAQKVLVSVSQAVEKWQPDPARAKFRTWLNRIAQNAAINAICRQKPDRGTGDSDAAESLAQQPMENSSDSALLQLEFRRGSFQAAARQIKPEFADGTWEAFWMTAIEGHSVETVSKRLERTPGSIYTARSRVMKRLQACVAEITSF